MQIRAGYDIEYECPQPTPKLLVLSIHPSRFADLSTPHLIRFDPPIPARNYEDGFGNICTRIVAPAVRPVSSRFSDRTPLPDPRSGRAHCRWKICRRGDRHLLGAAIARRTGSATSPGLRSASWRRGGASRRSATTWTSDRLRTTKSRSMLRASGPYDRPASAAISASRITLCRCMNIPPLLPATRRTRVPKDPPVVSAPGSWFARRRCYTFDARPTSRLGRIYGRGRMLRRPISTSFGPSRRVASRGSPTGPAEARRRRPVDGAGGVTSSVKRLGACRMTSTGRQDERPSLYARICWLGTDTSCANLESALLRDVWCALGPSLLEVSLSKPPSALALRFPKTLGTIFSVTVEFGLRDKLAT